MLGALLHSQHSTKLTQFVKGSSFFDTYPPLILTSSVTYVLWFMAWLNLAIWQLF